MGFDANYKIIMIQKVQAYIIRRKPHPELLLFMHDITRQLQVIRGTVDAGEVPEDTVRREIIEESGLTYLTPSVPLGEVDIMIAGGPTRQGPLEKQRHFAFLFEATNAIPDAWTHVADGSVGEIGLKFHFAWHSIDSSLSAKLKMEEMQYFIPALLAATK